VADQTQRLREVSEHTVALLLAADPIVRNSPSWREDHPELKAEIDVHNGRGEPLVIDLAISIQLPWKYKYQLRWGFMPIRRLDVRGSHRNICDGSNERWQRQTHKHLYRDPYRMSWAYSPVDIPTTAVLSVSPGEYRDVFEAFCKECGIAVECEWVDPDLDRPSTMFDQRGS
jgi:hypothetical protein